MLRTTHLGIFPIWAFVEGGDYEPKCSTREKRVIVKRAVPIPSQDGSIPPITCKACRAVAEEYSADSEYFVVFCAGQESMENVSE